MSSDLYTVLGVSDDASHDELKRAYRAIALDSHPDRNPGDELAVARFKAAAEAYRVLADPALRRSYDAGRQSRQAEEEVLRPAPRSVSLSRMRERGDDLRYAVRLTFEQAALGSRESLELPAEQSCTECGGSGAAPGTPVAACPDCEGEGSRPVASGFFRHMESCATCLGTGHVIRQTCGACAGLGTVNKPRALTVDIPAGVDDGDRLRLTGEGQPGVNGGSPGDLIIVVDIEPHPFFERDGADIYCDVPVTIGQAVLGSQVEIPTLEGQMRMKIPPGTQTGRLFRLKGQGMRPRGASERGDQLVRVLVEIPERLSDVQRELMQRWAEEEVLDGEHDVGAYRAALRKLYS